MVATAKPLFQPGYPMPLLLTIKQAAYILSLHPETVRLLVKGGELERREIGTGRYIRIPLESIERYAKEL